jgi:hypothetical protein
LICFGAFTLILNSTPYFAAIGNGLVPQHSAYGCSE